MGFCVVKLSESDPALEAFRQNAEDSQPETESFGKPGKEVIAMPAGDGTGPVGLGPMTGRAAGFCAGYPVPGYMNPVPGRGFVGRQFGVAYSPMPYASGAMPYGYGAGYAPGWPRSFGWFGRGPGRGWGRGFGRGRGRGRWFGW